MIHKFDHITNDAYNEFLNMFELQEYFNQRNVIYVLYNPRNLTLTIEIRNTDPETEQYIIDMCFYHLAGCIYRDIEKNKDLYLRRLQECNAKFIDY